MPEGIRYRCSVEVPGAQTPDLRRTSEDAPPCRILVYVFCLGTGTYPYHVQQACRNCKRMQDQPASSAERGIGKALYLLRLTGCPSSAWPWNLLQTSERQLTSFFLHLHRTIRPSRLPDGSFKGGVESFYPRSLERQLSSRAFLPPLRCVGSRPKIELAENGTTIAKPTSTTASDDIDHHSRPYIHSVNDASICPGLFWGSCVLSDQASKRELQRGACERGRRQRKCTSS